MPLLSQTFNLHKALLLYLGLLPVEPSQKWRRSVVLRIENHRSLRHGHFPAMRITKSFTKDYRIIAIQSQRNFAIFWRVLTASGRFDRLFSQTGRSQGIAIK